MKAHEKIAVIVAKDEGKTILQTIIGGTTWEPMATSDFDFTAYIYKVERVPRIIYAVCRGESTVSVHDVKERADERASHIGGEVITFKEVV